MIRLFECKEICSKATFNEVNYIKDPRELYVDAYAEPQQVESICR